MLTAAQLAAEVETTPYRLSRWLRLQRDAGHPLLAAIPARSPWRFTREQADELASEIEAAEAEGHVSDSLVQRRAEEVIRGLLRTAWRRACAANYQAQSRRAGPSRRRVVRWPSAR
jgi:hypothetical protein